ncbi:MAG TPA: carboxypeptidase regulatory-like domain-containing protein [Vicinamibacteria bacterium]|nr:carboxypeptidase regulatory-like domain-containing protein [Vicinamibacteria bacterium]
MRIAGGALTSAAALLLLMTPVPVEAQLTTGSIAGSVTDESGAAVPGATVQVVNIDTGVRRELVTDAGGRYSAPSLSLGAYEVHVSMQGFASVVRRGITMTAGRNAVVSVSLKVARQEENVEVVSEASPVETRSATVTHLVDEEQVSELPVINRDLTQLAFLQPGVIKSPAGQGVFSGQGDKMVVNGARGTQNLFLLDGVASGDVSGNPQGVSGVMNGSETIKEIQIVTNNYSAEYKSAVGAIVSAVTKSGTNTLHGSAFGYFRDDALNARNHFDEEFDREKPGLSREHFGGSIGGPIKKDRLFFFLSYEGLREEIGFTDTILVPSLEARQGRLANGTTVAVHPASAAILRVFPVPGQGNTLVQNLGDTALIAGTAREITDNDFVVGKLDFAPSGANTFAVTFSYDKGDRERAGLIQNSTESVGSKSETRTGSAKWQAVIGNDMINEITVGYSDSKPQGELPLPNYDYTGNRLIFRPGTPIMGEINIPGVESVGFRVGGASYGQKTLSIRDSFTWRLGRHDLRFGGEVAHMDFDVYNCSRGCNGVYDFRDLANFLRGTPRRFEGLLPGGDVTTKNLRQTTFAAYVQDNWTVRPSFTLNLGLRYEYANRIEEKDGFTSQLINVTDATATVGPLYAAPPTNLAFSPRIGFAWSPDQGRSSLRGGFGVFYEHPNLFLIRTALAELPPFTLVGRIETAPVAFPYAFETQLNLARARPNARAFDYTPNQTYALRWNLTYQRELVKDLVATVDYTSSRGRNLWHQNLANLCRWEGYPAQPSGDKFFPERCTLINPNLGEIRYQEANAKSWYDGVSAAVQRAPKSGVRFGGTFTVSKSTDTGSGVTSGGEELPQSQRGIYGYDLHLKKGPAATDRRFVASAFLGWSPAWGRDRSGASRLFARGWQFNAIFSYLSGVPLSVLEESAIAIARIGDEEDLRPDLVEGGDPNPVTGDPNRWFDISQFRPARPGYFGTLGRNTVRGPDQMTLDVSVLKDIEVGAGYLQVRAEVFNVTNRTNYGIPDMVAFINGAPNPTAGRITTTSTPARRAQLGLRWVF